jgi:serine/threonine protein kinase
MSEFTESDWNRLWSIFHQVKEAPDPEFLNQLEKQEPALFQELKQLLSASEKSGQILENLVAAEIQTLQEADSFEPDKIESGEILAGRFRIVRELGTGGMGTVYEALDEELGSSVALKVMRSDLAADDSARERFHREINLARRITHPNACRIFELFHHEEVLFLTMELLQGETLRQKIRRDGPMKALTAMPIVLQITQALSMIHSCGIIHRDLKSSNIILVPKGDQIRTVVTDFGLAIPLPEKFSPQVTTTGQVLGTPEFMAPEQLTRGKITPATDIYALGLLLYEMVTGSLPINEESSLTIAAKRISEDAPSPRTKAPDLGKNWERAILRCLERNPRDRFQNAEEFISALRNHSIRILNPFRSLRKRTALPFAIAVLLIGILGFLFVKRNPFSTHFDHPEDIVVRRLYKGATGLPGGLISTDGKILVDVDWQTADLIKIDLASGEKKRLTKSKVYFLPHDYSEYPMYTSLSQDGSQIAYSIKHVQDAGCDLRILNLRDQKLRTVLSNSENCLNPADWSSDGKKILALNSKKNGTAEITIVSAKDASNEILKALKTMDLRKMCLSPDGRYVVYDYVQDDASVNHDVFLLSVKDKSEKRIVQQKANDYVLGWSPDGTQVIFASDRSGTYDAWSIPVVQGAVQGEINLLRKDIGQIFPLKITREGSFYYAHMLTSRDLYTADLQSKATHAAKFPYGVVGSNRAPEFSPDGKFLYFQAAGNPIASRWDYDPPAIFKFLNLVTNEEHDLPLQLKPSSLQTRVSRNGQKILTTGNDGFSGTGAFEINLETGASVLVVRDPQNNFVREFDWSAVEDQIFYLLNKGGQIIQKQIASGAERKVFSGASSFTVSADGRFLGVTQTDIHKGTTSLLLVNSESGQPTRLLQLNMPEFIPTLTWTADGKSLLFAKGRRDLIDEPHEIWKVSTADGKAENLGMKSEYVTDIRAHPDNHRIILSTQIDSSEVWVMENFLTIQD